MDVISNNMANVSTTGFKKARAEFEDLIYENLKVTTGCGSDLVKATEISRMLIFNMAYKRDTLLSSEKKEELSDKVLTEMDE